MIRTGLDRVPWRWVIMLAWVSGVAHVMDQGVSGMPMTLLVKRFTVNPMLLGFISTIGPLMAIVIAPYVSWKSDRIWTRFGRRKPFILAGFALAGACLCLAPLVTNIWLLLIVTVLLYLGMDAGYNGPFAPLMYEVVPSPQRGRANVIKKVAWEICKLASAYFLLRKWDHVYHIWGSDAQAAAFSATAAPPAHGAIHHLSLPWLLPSSFHLHFDGAHLLYFTVALLVLVTWLGIALGLRETRPEKSLPREQFNPLKFLRDLLQDRQMIMVAMLLFCGTTLTVSLTGHFGTMMLSQQFGYSAATLAWLGVATNMVLLVIVMPVAWFVSDRIDRRILYRWGLVLGTLHHLAMWLVIRWVGIPSVSLWIFMVGLGYLVDNIAAVALEPMIFDMIPRSKMGTMNSGLQLISRIMSMAMGPIIGFSIGLLSTARGTDGTVEWDYSGGFLVYLILGAIGCGMYFFWVEPHWRQGKFTTFGDSAAAEPVEAQPAKTMVSTGNPSEK